MARTRNEILDSIITVTKDTPTQGRIVGAVLLTLEELEDGRVLHGFTFAKETNVGAMVQMLDSAGNAVREMYLTAVPPATGSGAVIDHASGEVTEYTGVGQQAEAANA